MNHRRADWSRREFVGGLTLGWTAGLLGFDAGQAGAEPPPETTKLRLPRVPGICVAPQYVAADLMMGEGFSDVQYAKVEDDLRALASGEIDIAMVFVAPAIMRVDAGDPIVLLAGVHIGCFELFGTNQVRAIRDLNGKTVAIWFQGSFQQIFLASIASHVGIDPRKDINWVTHPSAEAMRLLAEGKIDAYLGFPPEPQELRARKIGHVVVNSGQDRPWSQYFCCAVGGNREFVKKHPVATKRAVRAILKAASLCAIEPERAARTIVDRGFTQRYDYALQTMKEISYGKWREYDPADTVRFYALRLHEAGMIKSTPQKVIAQGTDWRFFNELKKELKG
jgi:NitT/TauT family transport system substrate-binding protein